MQRLKDLGLDPTRPTFSNEAPVQIASPAGIAPRQLMTKADVNRKITPEELREHNSEEEPWFAVNGEVLPFLVFSRLPTDEGLSRYTTALPSLKIILVEANLFC